MAAGESPIVILCFFLQLMLKKRFLTLVLFSLFVYSTPTQAQDNYRLSADFSIKQKEAGKGQLVTGKVYFDQKVQKLFYQIQFPQPAFWLVKDSMFYSMGTDTQLVKSTAHPYSPTFSIYQTILSRDFDDLGLKRLGFTIGTVEKADSIVITEWLPNEKNKNLLGKILLSHKDRMIEKAAFFDPKGNLISKEQYKNLQLIDDEWVPTEVTAITYKDGAMQSIKITSLRNIQFNEKGNDRYYDFPIPTAQ